MSHYIHIDYEQGIVTTIDDYANGSTHKRFYDYSLPDSRLWEICNDMLMHFEILRFECSFR